MNPLVGIFITILLYASALLIGVFIGFNFRRYLRNPRRAVKVYFYWRGKVVTHMFLKVTQSIELSVAFKDKFNNQATVDGKPAWAVTDPAAAELQVADDGMSAIVKPLGPLSAFKVQISADADLGEGVKPLLGEMDVETIAGEATQVAISAGLPQDLP